MEILFSELLCNDFSNNEIELTDIFPNSGNYQVTDSSIIITAAATGRLRFGYSIKGCDCNLQNGFVSVHVGVCHNCSEIDPCENLTCVNGFNGWDQGLGQFALHEYIAGNLWYSNLNNSLDVCKVSNNSFAHIGASVSNREGMALRLSEPILPGCTASVSYKASVSAENVFNWHASELAPCGFDDTKVGFDCTITQCDSYEYSPQCIYSDSITNIAENITQLNNLCPLEPNLDSTYTFKWKNGFDFPINYLILFPETPPMGLIKNYIDDIVITKSCLDPGFTFSFEEDCQEVTFIPNLMDSIYSHSWIFGDGDTSFALSPMHVFESIDTFSVQHFISDTCGNIDSFELDVIIPEESSLCCPDTTISASTLWDLGNLPYGGRFHTITVETGVAFTIDEKIELQFCEGGALIIETGAYVDLEGDLTSYENMTWKGIYVSGDSSLNQSIDLNSGGFNGFQQGFLQSRSGASIKNAEIAIRNYGPSGSSSSGGMIRCEETLFENNTIGIDFIEYQNFNDSINQPLPSLGSFTGCSFFTDTAYYLHDPFYTFARISKVDGVDFKASKFVNSFLPDLPSQIKDFGFGIMALDAEFKVHPDISTGSIGPCPPPCTMVDSTLFSGLGHGIYAMTELQARPYTVYNSLFENCFRGITDITRGGATILFNTFLLGEVPDQEYSYGQIGAEFHFAHDGFTLQENLFTVKDVTEVIPIGVLCDGLGEYDNEIRRNTFTGIETANQAFGENADTSTIFPGGLRYFCNSFENTLSYGYDFHIPNSPALDLIHLFQTPGSSQGSNVSTGNHFAYTAQDFMNFGEGGINYWYYSPGDNEEPRDSFSFNTEKDLGLVNECASNYCAPPCIQIIGDIKEDFFTHLDDYGVNLDNYINVIVSANQARIDSARSKALYYRRLSSRDAFTIVQHMMIDTLEYHIDSLIRWMGYLDTYGAEVMIAGEYAATGNFESALDVLETITARRDLSPAQSVDLGYLLEIYSLLEVTPLQSLTPQDRSFLRNFAYSNIGSASGVARALLSSFGEYIPLPYYHDEQIYFRNVLPDSTDTSLFTADQFPLSIYPNPSSSDITIEWNYPEKTCALLMVYDLFGKKVLELNGEYKSSFKLKTDDWKDGVHWIVAQDNEGFSHFGKVLIFKN